jgi:hypothetical protein
MKKRVSLLVLSLLCSTDLFSQGYVFTWHGDSNLYQASFQLTESEMQPDVPIGSSGFFNSLTVTSSLTGVTYTYDPQYDHVAGGVNPWSFGITLYNLGSGTEVTIYGGEPPVGAMAGGFTEHPFQPGPDFFYSEGGYFSFSAIPEPSVVVLAAIGTVVLTLKNAKA